MPSIADRLKELEKSRESDRLKNEEKQHAMRSAAMSGCSPRGGKRKSGAHVASWEARQAEANRERAEERARLKEQKLQEYTGDRVNLATLVDKHGNLIDSRQKAQQRKSGQFGGGLRRLSQGACNPTSSQSEHQGTEMMSIYDSSENCLPSSDGIHKFDAKKELLQREPPNHSEAGSKENCQPHSSAHRSTRRPLSSHGAAPSPAQQSSVFDGD